MFAKPHKKKSIGMSGVIVCFAAFIGIVLVGPIHAQTSSGSSSGETASSSSQSSADGTIKYNDEVILKNGSIIKGRIVYVASDSLLLVSDAFDPLELSVWDIRSINTANVVEVAVDSGEKWRGKISTNEKGEMVFEPEGGGKSRSLNFGFVDGIYEDLAWLGLEWEEPVRRQSEHIDDYLTAQIEAGCQAVQIFDSWAGCLSPSDYREFVLPYTTAVLDGLPSETPAINFLTGNPALLPIAAEAGGQIVGLDWRVDMANARAMLGPGRAVQGNLDPVSLLADVDTLKNRAHDVLKAAGPGGSHTSV